MNEDYPPQLFEKIDDQKICARCRERFDFIDYEKGLCRFCMTQIEIIRGLSELDKRKTY